MSVRMLIMKALAFFLISQSVLAAEVLVHQDGSRQTLVGPLDTSREEVTALENYVDQGVDPNSKVTPPELNANGQDFAVLAPETRPTALRSKPVVELEGKVETETHVKERQVIDGYVPAMVPVGHTEQYLEETIKSQEARP